MPYYCKIVNFSYKIFLMLILAIEILINSNNHALANDDNVFTTITTNLLNSAFEKLFGIESDKIDKSYNVANISNRIINRLSHNNYYRNNNILTNKLLQLSADETNTNVDNTTNDCAIYLSYYKQKLSSKANKTNNNYANIDSTIVNAGVNTDFNSLITAGLGYGLVNNELKAYRREKKENFGSDNMLTHIAIAYGYADFSMIKTNITLMAGTSKHKPKADNTKPLDYKSKFVSANLHGDISIDLLLINLHLIGYVSLADIYIDKYEIKYGPSLGTTHHIPKYKNRALSYSLAFTTSNQLDIKLIKFNYRISLGYKFTRIKGKTTININLPIMADNKLIYKEPPLSHNLFLDANLSLQLYKHLQLGLDINYSSGNIVDEYGIVVSASYLF